MKNLAYKSLVIGFIILVAYLIVLFANGYLGFNGAFSLDVASKIGPFITSFVGVFFTLASALLVIENLKISGTNNERNQLLTQKNQFESVFFGLLTQHRQLRDAIKTTVSIREGDVEVETSGTNFFDDIATRISSDFENEKEQTKEGLIVLYNHWFTIYNSDLGHYFRHLYHIVKFADRNQFFVDTLNKKGFLTKYEYVSILRAQISNSELIMLSLNCMTEQGEKFYPLVEQFKLLKNINLESEMPDGYHSRVPNSKIIIDFYPHL
jgi:hypothetical protein